MSYCDSAHDQSLLIPDPDDIRTAIQKADGRARLLRRLLRLALQIRVHLVTADRLHTQVETNGGQP